MKKMIFVLTVLLVNQVFFAADNKDLSGSMQKLMKAIGQIKVTGQ